MFSWETIIQPKLDYCSQLWSPSDQHSIGKLESIMRSYTSKIEGCQDLNYWQRLQTLKLYSQERRRERYQLIFIWKLSQGMVDGYNIKFTMNPRRGRLAIVGDINLKAHPSVRRARERSLAVKGAKMFNLLPQHLRDINSMTADTFKANLDSFLTEIPDLPTVPGCPRAAATNSLTDQIPMIGNQFLVR